MTLALNSKNKLGFVDGSINPPSKTTNPENYAAWSRCNDMVHSWIINTLNSKISDSVIYYTTVNEVWKIFVNDSPRVMHLESSKFNEILLIFAKNNSLSQLIIQN